jgi:cobalt/nickel transport system permease protein
LYLSFIPIIALCAFYARDTLLEILNKLAILNIFIMLVVASVLLEEKYDLAMLIFLRSNMVLFMILSLFIKKDAFELAIGLQELKLPASFVAVFFFSVKFIFIFKKELKKFIKTLHVRGFERQTSVFAYTTYANFIGILMVKAFHNAQKLQKVIELRGFKNKIFSLQETKTLSISEVFLVSLCFVSLFEIGKIV